MEGFMFSTPMIISPVNVEAHLGDVEEMIENSVSREYFVPDREPILEPYEGMEFESEEAARTFYTAYAAQTGFKARVSSFIRSKRDKTIISRQLVCSREGFRSTKDACDESRTKRPRMITRVGCRAMIMVKKQSSGKWVVSKCEKVHNHVLGTQGKVVMLDYDPYAREDEEMIENPLGRDSILHEGVGNGLEMVVVPPEGEPGLEPQVGMEFESEKDAQSFYKEYARHVGFRARVSSYYRSKRDNSIISRLMVCSKEGFRAKKEEGVEERLQRPRAITRVGCKAMLMVKKRNSGKWVVSKLVKNHNHMLTPRTASDDERSEAEDEDIVEIEKALDVHEGDAVSEPHEGMEFESEETAKIFYFAYSRRVGFNMRVSTYYRSKRDRSIISRLFVCSKEGFYVKKDAGDEGKIKRSREATRVGCRAMLMVKKNNSGKWVVSKFEKEHNHPLGSLRKSRKLRKRNHLSANANTQKDQIEMQKIGEESPISRYNNLFREAIKYAEVGATSEDVYNVAMRALRDAVKKVTAIKKNVAVPKKGMLANADNLEDDDHTDDQVQGASPLIQNSQTRTHPSNPLPKLSQDKLTQRLRKCNTCKQPNDNTSRSCPTKQRVNVVQNAPINISSDEPVGQLLQDVDQ
ncbi:FHY3/FAR1 family protein [Dioscorea alata]|uniref:FHY3/FAR1 family protein n=2 Tax=Dioscorea alata TaxID=55571 RepID=A0ACB7WQL8_DIOAL|nr:FHY3/FAR1 family protein [Dioscorea alata]KAH7690554.1 FHY3/FAR1 family protein [Dioscorea alata]